MKIHFQKVIQRRDYTMTGTLCNRMSDKNEDGINSTDNPEEVTCKFCQRLLKYRKAA